MVDSEGSSVQRVCARCGELIGEFGVYQLEESLRVDLHGGRDRFFFFRGGGGSCEAGGRGPGDRLRLGSCVEEWFRHIAARGSRRGSRRAHEELLEGQRRLSLCTSEFNRIPCSCGLGLHRVYFNSRCQLINGRPYEKLEGKRKTCH